MNVEIEGQETWTTGGIPLDAEWRVVIPIRAEDYPSLAAIWEGDDDDDVFKEIEE